LEVLLSKVLIIKINLYFRKKNMFPTNPAVTDGVELFVWIVVVLISFVGAVSIIDFRDVKKKS
tara:strand:- start:1095 stop:1283 length:189 start_codon:yes stop_codon:yes gene_type:complete